MSEMVTVGELAIAFLEACGCKSAFGVISIHNLPIVDAIARRGKLRFVPARNEAGAVNMADAAARVTGLVGVALTSTGAGCGNACGALLECQSAGTPLIHLTGNVDTDRIDRVTGFTHEAPTQFRMLAGASKAAFRVMEPQRTLETLREALAIAFTPPMGAVTIEIPIDIQKALVDVPTDIAPLWPAPTMPSDNSVAIVAERLIAARRPLIWLGGGAREASTACLRLADAGVGFVSSVQGRGILPDDHPSNLSSFSPQNASIGFYKSCDFALVVGSRLRSAQTRNSALPLPRPLIIVDADPTAWDRNYEADEFVCADAASFLEALAERVFGKMVIDQGYGADLRAARHQAEEELRDTLGPYESLLDALIASAPADFNWVRDITMNNSTWGNRLPALRTPRRGVYSVGGGIGMGLGQAIGAAIASPGRKTIALIGDGGFSLCLGEVATAVQEKADITILLMNDGGYGIMRNLQDAQYDGRQFAADLVMPDFSIFARSLGIPFRRAWRTADFAPAINYMLAVDGPSIVEFDMAAIGPFAQPFHGRPIPDLKPRRERV